MHGLTRKAELMEASKGQSPGQRAVVFQVISVVLPSKVCLGNTPEPCAGAWSDES